jgi:hypothetical protein
MLKLLLESQMLKLGGCRIVIISHVTRPPMQAANFCSKHGGR